ncbi:MAG TPA: PASTA domain-containing protein, partial [Euzebya sp.]|nr:PASTA domain-containing protein [Euzebya sp.]
PPAGDQVPPGAEVTVVVSRGIAQVRVPQVAGGALPDAEAAIAEAQLVLGDVTTEFSDEFPAEGTVISQSLPAGEEVDKGSTIDLQVSAGPLTVEVPEVQGMSVEDARAAIEGLGLVVVERTEPQRTLGPFVIDDANVVLRQIPSAGEQIQRGGEVEIFFFTPR